MVSNKFIYAICIALIIMLVGGVSATELKIGKTITNKSSIDITNNDVTFTDKATGVSVKTETKIDGVLFKPTTSKIDKGAIVFETTDSIATFKYEYLNDKLKETIILKEDKDLSFPITLSNGDKIMSLGNTWIINKDGSTTDGIIAEVPYGIDANGNRINMYYTYDGKNLNLKYNKMITVYNDQLTKTKDIRDDSKAPLKPYYYTQYKNAILLDHNHEYKITPDMRDFTKSPYVLQYDVIPITYPLTIDPTWTVLSGKVNFTSNKTTSYTYSPIQFNDTSTGSPTNWTWYFGDEIYNQSFILKNISSGWSARRLFGAVSMPDSSIVLMGGSNIGVYMNDTWRSTTNGLSWSRINSSSVWTARNSFSAVSMPDGSIVLMGGYDGSIDKNDVWRSTNNGLTWSLINSSSSWSARSAFSAVSMPDGSIVLMGGNDGSDKNDVWRSTNNGLTWSLINSSSSWIARYSFSAVSMPDGSIVLMGGYGAGPPYFKNDTWRSTNNGLTWSLMNTSSGWPGRSGFSAVSMPDGSIVLMGGYYPWDFNDTWRSTNNGLTWSLINSSPGWIERNGHSAVSMPNGSIVLMGGDNVAPAIDGLNDTWVINPSSSSIQNATKTYTTAGIYNITLTAFNSSGYNSTTKNFYMTVTDLPMYTNFTGTPTSILVGQSVQFNDTTTGSPPTSWQWTFGDLTTNTTSNAPLKTYTTAGIYTVSLTTINSLMSNTSTRTNYITVSNGTPYAEFTSNVTTGLSPLSVQFNDTTNASIATNWNWTFGVSNFSNLQNPAYTFTGIGRYNVRLNASTATTFNITNKVNYINVTAALTNPLSSMNLTSNTIYIGANDNIILSVKNITASAIYANISFNKSEVSVMNIANNFSVYPGLIVTSIISNASGFVYMNISNNSGGNIYIGNTVTPIVDMNFKALSFTNGSAPLNYISANSLLTTGGIENIVYKNPGNITTTNGNFTFITNIMNAATSSKVTTLVTINATGSNVLPNTQQTDTGSATFTSSYGNVVFEISAQGYYTLTQTKLVSDNSPLVFRLTPLSGSTQSTWYSPHQVRLTTIDNFNGQKLFGANIEVTAMSNTFPPGASTDWLISMYGINAASANDMMNGTLLMSGLTDGDGSVVFTMLSSIGYNIHITNVTAGIDHTVKLYPLENDYNIWISTLTNTPTLYSNIYNTSLTYNAPNSSYGTFGLTYQDTSGLTTQVIFNVTSVSNRTVMYSTTLSGFGSSVTYANYTIKAIKGQQYRWSYNATRVV